MSGRPVPGFPSPCGWCAWQRPSSPGGSWLWLAFPAVRRWERGLWQGPGPARPFLLWVPAEVLSAPGSEPGVSALWVLLLHTGLELGWGLGHLSLVGSEGLTDACVPTPALPGGRDPASVRVGSTLAQGWGAESLHFYSKGNQRNFKRERAVPPHLPRKPQSEPVPKPTSPPACFLEEPRRFLDRDPIGSTSVWPVF